MTRKTRERRHGPREASISRREMLERTGKYSIAVIGIAAGGSALSGCGPETADDVDPSCNDLCSYSGDGICDDSGPGSAYNACTIGTDCNDCGIRDPAYSNTYTDYANEYGDYLDGYADYTDDYSNGYYNTGTGGYGNGGGSHGYSEHTYTNAGYGDYSDSFGNGW